MKFRYFRSNLIIFCDLYGEIQKYVHILQCFFHLCNNSLMSMDPETFPQKKNADPQQNRRRKRNHFWKKMAGERGEKYFSDRTDTQNPVTSGKAQTNF